MGEKGEFEQRPEVKPASSVPLPKEKASPAVKILCAIFALIALCACGYIVYDKTFAARGDNDVAEPDVLTPPEKEELSEAKVDEETRAIVMDVYKGMSSFFEGATSYRTYLSFDNGVPYEFEDGYATSIDKSYGAWFISNNYGNDFYASLGKENYISMLDKIMKNHDLKRVTASKGLFFGEEVLYYSNDEGYVCFASTSSMPGTVECSNTKWLTDERKELVKDLIDAYKKGDKDAKNYDGAIYLYASEKDVKDSATKPYQTLQGSVLDAAILFYRKDEDSDWKYLAVTQNMNMCEWFDTDDEKAAYEGTACWDNATHKETTVTK